MKISVLNENTVNKRGYVAEHGLSLLIEQEGKRYLFDTGQTGCFLHNAAKMGEDLSGLDAVILSHGHYDHAGGLAYLAGVNSTAPVYAGRGAFDCKCCLNADGRTYRVIGVPWACGEESAVTGKCLADYGLEGHGGELHWNEGRLELGRDAVLLADIPGHSGKEQPAGQFYIRRRINGDEKYERDWMRDEQMLILTTPEGLAVFCGCAHPGIERCLSYVEEQFPGKHIHLLLAGMHLKQDTEGLTGRAVEAIRRRGIDVIMPVHCTGILAAARMKSEFKERCILMETGQSYEEP